MNLGFQVGKTMSLPNTSSSRKPAGDAVPDQFPAGLRVLVVDDDPTCLMILEKMLKTCLYQVTKSNRAEKALDLLRENRNGYDIIISDVHMPDMDGFKLLELVGLEMDLPVIMMSADDSKSVVMKGVTHGACDYLIKPVRIEALKTIWQHVVRRKKHEWNNNIEPSGSLEEGEKKQKQNDDVDYSSSENGGNWRNSRKRKEDEEEGGEEREDSSALKKPRVVWSVELHQQFMQAVDQLGVDKAVPKKILELMNVPGLTRENVASHLQKYRLYLRRLSGVSQHHGLGNSYINPRDANFGSINGLDLQALASSGHLPPQSLAALQAANLSRSLSKLPVTLPMVDQRNNIFSFENPSKLSNNNNISNSNNNKQVNLLHGIPTTMEPKQLANIRGINMNNNINYNSNISRPSSLPVMQNPSFLVNNVRASTYNPISQPSSVVDFTCIQNNTDNSKISQGFAPSYDIFSDLAQHKTTENNWELQNVVQPSVLVNQGFSSGQNFSQNRNGNGNGNGIDSRNVFAGENSMRVKSELVQEFSGQNGPFSDQFGQEDLLSALLKQHQDSSIGPVPHDFGFDGFPPLDNLPV